MNIKYKKIFYCFLYFILILFIFSIFNNFIQNNEYFDNNTYILPKIIYIYWDNLDNNKIIQSHIQNWKNNLSNDWNIIIIDKNNLNKYVSNNFIKKYNKLDATRFSDFLRLELLKNKGGVWMDACIFITNSHFLNNYYKEMINNQYDCTLYELKVRTIDNNIPYLENWFIMAKKNSILINDLYNEFNKSFELGFLNYKNNILIPSGVRLDKTIGYQNKTYLMQHAIINYLMYTNKNKYIINIKDAQESMFKIHTLVNWNDDLIIKYIMTNLDWNDIYAVKLVKSNRRAIKYEQEYINKINSL